MASRSRAASRFEAASRFRHWERCSLAVTVSRPFASRRPIRCTISARWVEFNVALAITSKLSVTRVSEVFTCWPPGPLDRLKLQSSSASGMVSSAVTTRAKTVPLPSAPALVG